MFGTPFVQPPPAVVRPQPATCNGCMNKDGELAAKNGQISDLKAAAEALREQITDLQAALNEREPTDSEMAELRARMHLNAKHEQEQRRRADRLEGELAHERRTVANLHQRFRNLGMTP